MRLFTPLRVLASLLVSSLASPVDLDPVSILSRDINSALLEKRVAYPCAPCVSPCNPWIGLCAGTCGATSNKFTGPACGVRFHHFAFLKNTSLRLANICIISGMSHSCESSYTMLGLCAKVRDRRADDPN